MIILIIFIFCSADECLWVIASEKKQVLVYLGNRLLCNESNKTKSNINIETKDLYRNGEKNEKTHNLIDYKAVFVKPKFLSISMVYDMPCFQPENILLQEKGSTAVKLIDFGLSRKIGPKDEHRALQGTAEFVGRWNKSWRIKIMQICFNALKT